MIPVDDWYHIHMLNMVKLSNPHGGTTWVNLTQMVALYTTTRGLEMSSGETFQLSEAEFDDVQARLIRAEETIAPTLTLHHEKITPEEMTEFLRITNER